jgi:hypothetical protein
MYCTFVFLSLLSFFLSLEHQFIISVSQILLIHLLTFSVILFILFICVLLLSICTFFLLPATASFDIFFIFGGFVQPSVLVNFLSLLSQIKKYGAVLGCLILVYPMHPNTYVYSMYGCLLAFTQRSL